MSCPVPLPEEVDLVIYHSPCTDGFGSAFAAWKLLGRNAVYYPARYGVSPPDVTGRNVAIVDFSYKKLELLELMSKAKSLIVLDHHKSAEADLAGLEANTVFDMKRSGATIAWSFFHPDTEVPLFLKYIQDRDIWTWQLPQSKEFSAGLDVVPYEFDRYDEFMSEEKVKECIKEGVAIYKFINFRSVEAARNCELRVMKDSGQRVGFVNTPSLISEIGSLICSTRKDLHFSMSYYYDAKKRVNNVSLRAANDNDVDVSVIAAKFGGGGHAKAAGFLWKGNMEDLFE